MWNYVALRNIYVIGASFTIQIIASPDTGCFAKSYKKKIVDRLSQHAAFHRQLPSTQYYPWQIPAQEQQLLLVGTEAGQQGWAMWVIAGTLGSVPWDATWQG
ncbi:hypothetical protein NDU88_001563 [Pleurodeles waltl]|uniref:Uncharacterized protein n=1 Tax=Pleurodeles waltl TaxID=8319 RepID=A0AAV7KPS9_PLEWA|nr:hypothetical protein NDU88_001563 [Pleurodeles waltl]